MGFGRLPVFSDNPNPGSRKSRDQCFTLYKKPPETSHDRILNQSIPPHIRVWWNIHRGAYVTIYR